MSAPRRPLGEGGGDIAPHGTQSCRTQEKDGALETIYGRRSVRS
jgi:hypothetical protein